MAYYSRSLQLSPSTAAYNNRALMCIKLERFEEAVEDCCKVLEEDANNVKGLSLTHTHTYTHTTNFNPSLTSPLPAGDGTDEPQTRRGSYCKLRATFAAGSV